MANARPPSTNDRITCPGVEPESAPPTVLEPEELYVPVTCTLPAVTSHFSLVFKTVSGITVLALLVLLGFSFGVDDPTDGQQNALDLCSALVTAGFGALIGLIGGKVA